MNKKFISFLIIAALIAAILYLLFIYSNKNKTTNTNLHKKHAQQVEDSLLTFNTHLFGKQYTTKALLDCCINRKINPNFVFR